MESGICLMEEREQCRLVFKNYQIKLYIMDRMEQCAMANKILAESGITFIR